MSSVSFTRRPPYHRLERAPSTWKRLCSLSQIDQEVEKLTEPNPELQKSLVRSWSFGFDSFWSKLELQSSERFLLQNHISNRSNTLLTEFLNQLHRDKQKFGGCYKYRTAVLVLNTIRSRNSDDQFTSANFSQRLLSAIAKLEQIVESEINIMSSYSSSYTLDSCILVNVIIEIGNWLKIAHIFTDPR